LIVSRCTEQLWKLSSGFTHAIWQFVYILSVFLYSNLMIVAEATETYRWLMIYSYVDKSIFCTVLYMCLVVNSHLMLGCGRCYLCTVFRLSFVNQCSLKIAIINSRNMLVHSSTYVNQWNVLCNFWLTGLMHLCLLHGRCLLLRDCLF